LTFKHYVSAIDFPMFHITQQLTVSADAPLNQS
jgi:hypothetical protein